jgi:hypothetical protein
MATYKEIKGSNVENFSSDPANPINGQVWYNTTSSTLKVSEINTTGSWASGGNMPGPPGTGNFVATAGTQTAALGSGGKPAASSPTTNATIEYNGTAWTGGGNMGTSRYGGGGGGTQTSAVGFGGNTEPGISASTEEYNGSSWTAGGNMGAGRYNLGGCGTQTAALAFGGRPGENPPYVVNATEEYGGTSWTTGGNMPVARYNVTGCGTQTAGLCVAGTPPTTNQTFEYNGTAWTGGGTLNVGIRDSMTAAGIQTAAIAFGGSYFGVKADTELYDGTSWTAGADLNTGRQVAGGAGTQTAGLAFGGFSSTTQLVLTEEFTGPGPIIETVTTS